MTNKYTTLNLILTSTEGTEQLIRTLQEAIDEMKGGYENMKLTGTYVVGSWNITTHN